MSSRQAVRANRADLWFVLPREPHFNLSTTILDCLTQVFRHKHDLKFSKLARFHFGARIRFEAQDSLSIISTDARPDSAVVQIIQGRAIIIIKNELAVGP